MSSVPMYKNPFSQYNANLMGADEIFSYWCSPFFGSRALGVDEEQVFTDAQPIVFEGGRGTGKTMFLRYFSHEVQLHAFYAEGGRPGGFLDYLKQKGGVGVYVRMDGALVRDFSGKGVSDEEWDAVFTHYFELHVCQRYVELLLSLYRAGAVSDDSAAQFAKTVGVKLAAPAGNVRTLADTAALIAERIDEVRDYRARVPFERLPFRPVKPVGAGDLTNAIPDALTDALSISDRFRFVVLIDEYENFSAAQQRVLNTFLKFPKQHAAFRVGMRLEGFHTTETMSETEFIKEGRDYLAATFEDVLTKDPDYRNFLREVARKRLEATPFFFERGRCDIEAFLGKREDLEREARELVHGRKNPTRHLARALKHIQDESDRQAALEELRCPENPLLEMMNAVWITRGRSVAETKQGMRDYLQNRDTSIAEVYRRDYVDKHKLSLMFLLASQYQADKLYYSFNTYCFLSSGIVGNFLELCRRAFQVAAFEGREELFENGEISWKLQDSAAREVARTELDMIGRIREHGIRLSKFALNLGNCFRYYHTDDRLRYPETNQLSVDLSTVEDKSDYDAFKAAVRWSVIQRKPRLQGTGPGKAKTEVYTLNRVLSPIFQISYRTRGQRSEAISGRRLTEFLSSDHVMSSLEMTDANKSKSGETQDLSLFPSESEI